MKAKFTLSLTLRALPGSMRNLAALAAIALASGCATSGPNHLYATFTTDSAIHDVTAGKDIPKIIRADDHVVGLAYDFNTDHLFARIAPAQIIRVIERPSGKILREMPLPIELHATTHADLAIRSSDRHLFAVHRDGRSIVELHLFGKTLRVFSLVGQTASIDGLAFDQRDGHLLVLTGNLVVRYSVQGGEVDRVTLDAPINRPVSLGYDSHARHYFVPLDNGYEIGEFDANGQMLGITGGRPEGAITALDAGARSLVRVF
ncbi:hypothetical protein [Oleiharenicola lentus]|uniref:hypothetical protein n=1 Tax=Oleiharenicola lentus TaxID=2508720 RepID=UPI003F669AD9